MTQRELFNCLVSATDKGDFSNVSLAAALTTATTGNVTFTFNRETGKFHAEGEMPPPGPTFEMIDLQLPSGTLWANMNLGATCRNTPESWYGDYYAWGEVESKDSFYGTPENAYKWGLIDVEDSSFNITKYCSNGDYGVVDYKETLEAADDVATALLNLRIPKLDDIRELLAIANTSHEWVTNYNNVPSLNGMLFTSVRNNKQIFMPASGYVDGTTHKFIGVSGGIWCDKVGGTPYNAENCYFNNSGIYEGLDRRYYGMVVRAVQ